MLAAPLAIDAVSGGFQVLWRKNDDNLNRKQMEALSEIGNFCGMGYTKFPVL